MKTNKNIDRLFQEKLKDFEVSPPANIWEGIESNLHQKKPKSILPLWSKISGAAAILLLLTFGGISYFNNTPDKIIITDSKEDIENTSIDKNDLLNPVLNNTNENNSVITNAIQNNDEVSETLKGNIPQNEKQQKFDSSTETNQVSEVNNKEENNFSNVKKGIENNNKSINSESVIANINTSKNEKVNSRNTPLNKGVDLNKKEEGSNDNSQSQIASELTSSNKHINNSVINTTSKSVIASNDVLKNQNKIKTEKSNSNLNNSESFITNNDTKSENNSNNTIANNEVNVNQHKKEKFEENINLENNLDSIQNSILSTENVAVIPNKYDHLLNSDTEDINEEEDEKDTKKWSVASTIAPIYYNTFNTKGSPLDLKFRDSPKTGSKSVAYGVKVGYKLNDKLTLQASVSKIDVGYKIGDVFINPTQQYQVRLTNVNYANTNTAAILNVNAGNFLNDASIETSSSTGFTGELNQSFGYIEVPLELKYSLTDTSKKLGVNLIGGFSTLLLNKNEVFVTTPEFSSNLGEANNLNKVNFSGNIGVDIDYKINKKIYINVAPMLKIHTKTFSNNDNNFEPYIFGVYTGLNYRF